MSIVRHVRQPILGIVRVQGYESRARFKNSEQTNYEVHGSLDTKPDDGIRPNSQVAKMKGDFFSALAELPIGQPLLPKSHRLTFRVEFGDFQYHFIHKAAQVVFDIDLV